MTNSGHSGVYRIWNKEDWQVHLLSVGVVSKLQLNTGKMKELFEDSHRTKPPLTPACIKGMGTGLLQSGL